MSIALLPQTGRLEVIAGCMFSGKTGELIRRLRRAQIARRAVLVVKPLRDDRYATSAVASHDQVTLACSPLRQAAEILDVLGDHDVIGIDEAQFFDAGLPRVVERIVAKGRLVIVAGLDLDFRGAPFGSMPELLALADEVVKTSAVCTVCGAPATRSQRLVAQAEQVLVGAADRYAARCPAHWEPHRFDAQQQNLPLAGAKE